MNEEFCLSDKIVCVQRENNPVIYLDDVKEFIKEEGYLIALFIDGKIGSNILVKKRNKLVGEVLRWVRNWEKKL